MPTNNVTRDAYPRIAPGYSPGVPMVNIKAQFARFQGFTPTGGELYWTIQAEQTQDSSQSAIVSSGMELNPKIGFAGPKRKFYDVPNYIEGLKFNKEENARYTDSDIPAIEQGWRTWIRKTNPYIRFQGEPAQSIENEYPEGYQGTQYVPTHFSPSTGNASATAEDALQMIEQTQEGAVSGSLIQKVPFSASQEFRFKFYVYKPKKIDKTAQVVRVPFEGFLADPETGLTSQQNVPECGPSFIMLEIGRGHFNNVFICFPYGESPFMFDASASEYKVYAPDDSWIIDVDKEFMDIGVSDDRSKIILENQSGSKWEFPDATITKKIANSNAAWKKIGGAWNSENAYYLPSSPLVIHHRGLKFGFNITPAEYAFSEVKTVDESISQTPIQAVNDFLFAQANIFVSPPVMYSSEQQILPGNIENIGGGGGLNIFDFAMNPTTGEAGVNNAPGSTFTRSGISIPDAVQFYIVPASPYWGAIGGNDPSQTFSISLRQGLGGGEGDVTMSAYQVLAIIRAVKPYPGIGPSAAYYRPKIYGIRTIAHTLFMPDVQFEYDLSNYCTKLTYNHTHDDFTLLRKTYNLEFYVPQKQHENVHGNITRKSADNETISWEKLRDNPAWIKIHHWWFGEDAGINAKNNSNRAVPSFTGMTQPPSQFSDTASRTTLNLKAVDLLKILEISKFTNSPFYDGMSVPYAIGAILERAGYKARINRNGVLDVVFNDDKDTWFYCAPKTADFVLPYSGIFSQPLLQFQNGTPILEGIKRICQMFKLVFYTDRNSKFVLSLAPGNHFEYDGTPSGFFSETNSITPVDSFYSMFDSVNFPSQTDMMKVIYNTKITELPSSQGWGNIFQVLTVDKFTGNLIGVTRTDADSIFDPEAENFLGYMSMYFSQKSALGGRFEANQFLNAFTNLYSKPVRRIEFETWGQDHLLPLEIVQIDNNNIRIHSIDGTIERSAEAWKTTISGFHYGNWNSDVDISHPGDYSDPEVT